MQSLIHNYADILVLNSNSDSKFCPGCADQAQNWFWDLLKIKSPQQEYSGTLSYTAPRESSDIHHWGFSPYTKNKAKKRIYTYIEVNSLNYLKISYNWLLNTIIIYTSAYYKIPIRDDKYGICLD